MTRQFPLFLFVAFFAAAPLAAQTTEPAPDEAPQDESTVELGDRMERSEEGTLRGTIVLVDDENLIVETNEGDRAFSIGTDSDLPAELRDAAEWATLKGAPISIDFQPGDDGELRVVERVTLLPPTSVTTTTTTTASTETPVEPMPETDLGDESDVVEPTEVTVTAGDTTTEAPVSRLTTGQEIADANPDEADARTDADTTATAALADDDDLPPAADTMASLPATASALPRVALLGTLALLAGLALAGLEARRRKVAIADDRR